jgi:hypothetical protein
MLTRAMVLSLAGIMLSSCGGGGSTLPVGAPVSAGPASSAAPSPAPSAAASALPSAAPTIAPTAAPTSAPTASSSLPAGVPEVGGCQIFPSDNAWNEDVSQLPVDPNSAIYLASMNAATTNLHPDFGSNPTYGIPYTVVPSTQPGVPVTFQYASQSDPGPYPIPSNAPIEGGPGATGDRHVLVVQSGACKLYEMWEAYYAGPGWTAGSGAVFNLNSDALRPDYWTSADAAGLPVLAGLVRYDEATSGVINHAFRFTVHATQNGFIHPATHYAGSDDWSLPPMGLRVRLKSSYDISGFTGVSHTILVALKKYGMLLADNGSDWYITGATDTRWDDNDLNQLKSVPASAFEVVQTGAIVH